jgi:hypothetical protein
MIITTSILLARMPTNPPLEIQDDMNMTELTQTANASHSLQVDIMRNPSDLSEWVIWVSISGGKMFLLSDDQGTVIAQSDANQLIQLLKMAGVKHAKIHI